MTDAATLMAEQRWLDAAAAFELDGEPCLARLCRNLHAMRNHRPEVYEQLITTEPDGRWVIVPGQEGMLTVELHDGPDIICLSPRHDPRLAVRPARESLEEAIGKGSSIGLLGVGDGYLVASLAAEPQRYLLGRQQPLHLFEPDADLLAAVLMIHDYTGPAGPIEQARVRWYVGPNAMEDFEQQVQDDLSLACPVTTVRQHPRALAMQEELNAILDRLHARDALATRSAETYYAGLPLDNLRRAMDGTLGRAPRVMLLTTRFSTVLQYSTFDTADALRKLGFETCVRIEAQPWHSLNPMAVRQTIHEFRPDAVMQIDHLRHEHGASFPPGLPFICWIQDHKDYLNDPKAGQQVGSNDFVLTGARFRYTHRYAYPPRQVIDMPKVTRRVQRPEAWACDGDDIAYVSHWSHVPAVIAADLVEGMAKQFNLGQFMAACCVALTRHYDAGFAATEEAALHPIVEDVRQSLDVTLSDAQRKYTVYVLFERLNNALYRQQSLQWTIRYATDRGLKFRIYGLGWEKHPAFSQYAGGAVKYGPELEDLTRRTKVMLNIEPYACFTHQRMLDGLMAGGFFVVRSHPFNTLLPKLGQFVRHKLPAEACSIEAARTACAPEDRPHLEHLLQEARPLYAMGDPIEILRSYINARIVPDAEEAMPHLADVSFENEQQLIARLDTFLNNPALRQAITDVQLQSIGDRLTYEAAWKRAMDLIANLSATRTTELLKEAA